MTKKKAPVKERISSFLQRHEGKKYTTKQIANYTRTSIHTVRRRLADLLKESNAFQKEDNKITYRIIEEEEEESTPSPPIKKQHYRHYVSEFVYCDARNKFVIYALKITDSKDDIESDLLDSIEAEYSHCDIIKNYGYSIDDTDESLSDGIETGILVF